MKASKLVQATVRMEMSPRNVHDALDALVPLVERTRAEAGCVSCRLYRDVQQADTIMLEEYWSNPEDLHRHLRSPYFRRVLLVIELAKGQPEVRFNSISHFRGFEAIVEAQNAGAETG